MRKGGWFLLAVVFVLGAASIAAAFPHVINYQGILRDGAGKVVADGPYSVTFRFYDIQAGGTALWEETQSITTKSGLFNALLGSTIEVPDTVFANDSWLGIVVGTDPEMAPRTRVAAVGYAYHARNSDLLQGLGPGEIVYPTTPGQVFRYVAFLGGGASQTFPAAGRIRQITGIVGTTGNTSAVATMSIEGSYVVEIVANSTFGQFTWSSCNGAPIQVGASESVTITNSLLGAMYVTITGFEY